MTKDSAAANATAQVEGLRERKKRQTRERLSRTAAQMFLERGFDDVKVAEIAERCEVSEKTVYNYFPTKEALVLIRESGMAAAIRAHLGPDAPPAPPVEAALRVLEDELKEILRLVGDEGESSIAVLARFLVLFATTPSLRAAHRDMEYRLTQIAAEALAARAGVDSSDPEPQIAAHTILGLWAIQYHALQRYSAEAQGDVQRLGELVNAEVRRAAMLIEFGLRSADLTIDASSSRKPTAARGDRRASRRPTNAALHGKRVRATS